MLSMLVLLSSLVSVSVGVGVGVGVGEGVACVIVAVAAVSVVSDVGVGLGAVLVLVSMVSALSVTPALVSVFSFAAEPPLFAEIKKEAEFSSNVNNAPNTDNNADEPIESVVTPNRLKEKRPKNSNN